ncbi:MAG: U32 family peptidase [Bacilli bacterium]|nr:U32 family peptidase [Bacilli bacterium]
MKPEILSPAGSMDAFYAAIEAGCDAVYIGGKHFGARAFSKNFSNEEIEYVVNYAHLYDVKVYVTVNTLVYDDEIDECLSYLKFLHKTGVDAVIMQDLGMIDLTRKVLPNLEIHISTQAHIHNLDGVKILEKLGIKRTVLARETSIEEIEYIKENSNIDLEIFVAGALCISYSGNCLMSSLIGGRSGNRGMCAGSCRLPYDLIDDKGNKINKDNYLLSTKDLNTLEYIGNLIDTGVTSFKIEGRMKSPEYVYIITSLYRKAVDSYIETGSVYIDEKEIDNLKKVFNRGFTKGFIFNESNNDIVNTNRPNHMGVKIGKVIDYHNGITKIKLEDNLSINDGIRILGNTDTGLIVTNMRKDKNTIKEAYKGDIISIKVDDKVSIGSTVLKTKDSKLVNDIYRKITDRKRKVNIDLSFKAKIDGMSLKAKYKDIEIEKTGTKPDKAINRSMTKEDIIKQLSKLGDTPYTINNLDIDLADNLFINIKDLNELRRKVIDSLTEKRLEKTSYVEKTYSIDLDDYKEESNINYKINDIDVLNKLSNYKDIYVEDIDLYNKIPDSIYILPRVLKDYPTLDRVMISELGGLNKYHSITGPYMNVTNSYTVAFLHSMGVCKVTLSYEMTYEKVRDLVDNYHKRYGKHPNLEVVVYGNIEAMISKYNMLKKYNLDEGNYYLVSKFKNKYPIKIRDEKMIIYYDEKRIDDNNYFDIGVNNIRIDIDNPKDLKNINLSL